ncbi:hypothetical protein K461DRAFT_268270 [Myriangium duriaei CBS 260.36]|uniref:Uncharacterized protein n=1 Tax=Myriangium duriaei CBS 260.36 TaxID=1168546 RepID=A0A9P4J2L5_9PEZI|nr:hypothetical protein K461DRAFT_268270 [Myriangium duriaei CBS 260.36]
MPVSPNPTLLTITVQSSDFSAYGVAVYRPYLCCPGKTPSITWLENGGSARRIASRPILRSILRPRPPPIDINHTSATSKINKADDVDAALDLISFKDERHAAVHPTQYVLEDGKVALVWDFATDYIDTDDNLTSLEAFEVGVTHQILEEGKAGVAKGIAINNIDASHDEEHIFFDDTEAREVSVENRGVPSSSPIPKNTAQNKAKKARAKAKREHQRNGEEFIKQEIALRPESHVRIMRAFFDLSHVKLAEFCMEVKSGDSDAPAFFSLIWRNFRSTRHVQFIYSINHPATPQERHLYYLATATWGYLMVEGLGWDPKASRPNGLVGLVNAAHSIDALAHWREGTKSEKSWSQRLGKKTLLEPVQFNLRSLSRLWKEGDVDCAVKNILKRLNNAPIGLEVRKQLKGHSGEDKIRAASTMWAVIERSYGPPSKDGYKTLVVEKMFTKMMANRDPLLPTGMEGDNVTTSDMPNDLSWLRWGILLKKGKGQVRVIGKVWSWQESAQSCRVKRHAELNLVSRRELEHGGNEISLSDFT